jgi:hypothetical protein
MSRRRTLLGGGGGNVGRFGIDDYTRASLLNGSRHRHGERAGMSQTQNFAVANAPSQRKHGLRNSGWWLARASENIRISPGSPCIRRSPMGGQTAAGAYSGGTTHHRQSHARPRSHQHAHSVKKKKGRISGRCIKLCFLLNATPLGLSVMKPCFINCPRQCWLLSYFILRFHSVRYE